VIGETKNTMPFDKTLILDIDCAALSQGVYCLEALVTVRPVGEEITDDSEFNGLFGEWPTPSLLNVVIP